MILLEGSFSPSSATLQINPLLRSSFHSPDIYVNPVAICISLTIAEMARSLSLGTVRYMPEYCCTRRYQQGKARVLEKEASFSGAKAHLIARELPPETKGDGEESKTVLASDSL